MPITLSLGRLAALLPCALLAACSAKYVANRVTPEQVRVTTPGIYYSLPKTELLVVVGVKKTTKKSGIYGGDVWDDCVKACTGGKSKPAGSCPSVAPKPKVSYELTSVKSYSRSIADPAHLYHVELDLKAFASFSHTFKLSNEGILTSSTSEIENKGVEVAINSAKAALSLVAATKGALPKADEASEFIDKDSETCKAFRASYTLQQRLDKDIQDRRDAMDRIIFSKTPPEGPAIEQLIKRHEARISELKASPTYEKLMEHRAESSKEEAIGDFAVQIKPDEFTPAQAGESDWHAIQQIDTEGFAGLELKPGKQSEINGVVEELAKIKIRVAVNPTFGFGQENADVAYDACAGATAKPTRQRLSRNLQRHQVSAPTKTRKRHHLPARARRFPRRRNRNSTMRRPATAIASRQPPRYVVTRAFLQEEEKDKDGTIVTPKKCWREPIGKFRTLVAQYGAVTAMPPKITGVKSKIMLDLYESTGSPRQVDVGATPMPSTVVGDALHPCRRKLSAVTRKRKTRRPRRRTPQRMSSRKSATCSSCRKRSPSSRRQSNRAAARTREEEESEEPAAN